MRGGEGVKGVVVLPLVCLWHPAALESKDIIWNWPNICHQASRKTGGSPQIAVPSSRTHIGRDGVGNRMSMPRH